MSRYAGDVDGTLFNLQFPEHVLNREALAFFEGGQLFTI